jgi:hypothetical protein
MRVTRPPSSTLVMAAFLSVASVAALWYSGPPRPAADAAPNAFSASRAVTHVANLAQRPHPMGSEEQARVRDFLIAEVKKLGFAAEHQRETAMRVRGDATRPRGVILAGLVDNILVRIPGRASTGVVLMASHYDSVPAGPGAADDTAAVAAMLETLRALKAGTPLKNDVVALFTDGEEDGLLGAEAFVSRHPWAREVRAVVNFEARGNRGAVHMFQTTPGNAKLVRTWASTVPRPDGTSLAYEVYKRLPNDTDFTEFLRLNAVGLNFAFIDNAESYHTPADSADNLDRGSLQGHGEVALSLVRRFGDATLDLSEWRSGDAVYFSVPGGYAFHYGTIWAIPAAVIVLLLWVWAFARARRQGGASLGGLILAVVLEAGILAGLGWLAWRAPGWLAAVQDRVNPLSSPETSQAHALALGCAALMLWLVCYLVGRLRMAAHTWAFAASLILILAAGALGYLMPGASYLALWPAAGGIFAAALLPVPKGDRGPGAGASFGLMLAALPAIGLLVPTMSMLVSALFLTPEGAVGLVVLIGVAVLALVPQIEAATLGRRWWLPMLLGLVATGAGVAGLFTASYGARHPRPENIVYALDADAGRAVWATTSDPAGPWLEQFVTATPKRGPLAGFTSIAGQTPFLSAQAPAVDLAGPAVTLVRSVDEGQGRALTVRLTSPRRARALSVRLPDREVLDTHVNGREPGGRASQWLWTAGRWSLEFTNIPADGVELFVRVKGREPVTFVVADRSDGLPASLAVGRTTRPASSQPIHRGDMTVVQRTVTY